MISRSPWQDCGVKILGKPVHLPVSSLPQEVPYERSFRVVPLMAPIKLANLRRRRLDQIIIPILLGGFGAVLGTPMVIWIKILTERHLRRLYFERQIREPFRYIKPVAWWGEGGDPMLYYVRIANRNFFPVTMYRFRIMFVKSRRVTLAEFAKRVLTIMKYRKSYGSLRGWWESIADHDTWFFRTSNFREIASTSYRGEKIVLDSNEVCTVHIKLDASVTPYNAIAFLQAIEMVVGREFYDRFVEPRLRL